MRIFKEIGKNDAFPKKNIKMSPIYIGYLFNPIVNFMVLNLKQLLITTVNNP